VDSCWTAVEREWVLTEVADELWRYVGRHARDISTDTGLIANLTGLSPRALDTLRHLRLLLSDEVALFVDETLPELLRRRRATTARRVEVGRGAVRGPVLWGVTVAARARTGGAAPDLYASSTAHKYLDTPEAQVLTRLLQGLDRSVGITQERIGELEPSGWGARVAHIADAVSMALAQVDGVQPRRRDPLGASYLPRESYPPEESYSGARIGDSSHRGRDGGRQDAGAPSRDGASDGSGAPSEYGAPTGPEHEVTPAALNACAHSTRAAVRALADVFGYYRDMVETPASEALLWALRTRALTPLDDDALYELWALLGAVAVFDESGWRLRTAELIGQDPTPMIYSAGDGRTTARLHFQHTPLAWRGQSRYRAIFERHGLSGAVRRPDLIVELRRGRHRRYALIEVKRTRHGGYIADSIYKALGYLADFEAVFEGQRGVRELLALWDTPDSGDVVLGDDLSSGNGDSGGGMAPDTLVLATHRTYRHEARRLLDGLLAELAE
jgi:hypothetical protein